MFNKVTILVLAVLVFAPLQYIHAGKDVDEKSLYQIWPEVKHPVSRHVAAAEILCRTAMSN